MLIKFNSCVFDLITNLSVHEHIHHHQTMKFGAHEIHVT